MKVKDFSYWDRWVAVAAGIAILFPSGAFAFDYPLQPEEVREAYYLGQLQPANGLSEFLARYRRDFKYPSSHPVVDLQAIEISTPYEQVVERSQQGGSAYTKFQADEDYRKELGSIMVRVLFTYRVGYAGPLPTADDFKVSVSQSGPIEPLKRASFLLCNPFYGGCYSMSEELDLTFDPNQFAPERTRIKVVTPDGQAYRAKFDLSQLK